MSSVREYPNGEPKMEKLEASASGEAVAYSISAVAPAGRTPTAGTLIVAVPVPVKLSVPVETIRSRLETPR